MNGFWEDIIQQLKLAPYGFYEVLLLMLIIGSFVLMALYREKAVKNITILLLFEYVFLIYGLTVIFRETSSRLSHIFKPFWSYKEMLHGKMQPLIYEMVMNVVLFLPVGFLLGSQVSKRSAKQQWLIVFLLGMGLSISIEVLQLVFQKGSFEFDDIMHNPLGCLIGLAIWRGCAKLIVAIKSHNGNNSQETT